MHARPVTNIVQAPSRRTLGERIGRRHNSYSLDNAFGLSSMERSYNPWNNNPVPDMTTPDQRNRIAAPRSPMLRRGEQAAVAVMLLLLLLSLAGHALRLHDEHRRFIDIDRAEPLTADFKVDINMATWPELAQLPRIGEALARRIVETRKNEGPFIGHEDLMRVRGIGPRTLQRIQPYLMPMPDAASVAGTPSPAETVE